MLTCVFVDSDVVISSLLSPVGAAYFLLTQSEIKPVISSTSLAELREVVNRLGLDTLKLESLIQEGFEVHNITKPLNDMKQEYGKFVTDIHDAHIVAGAHISDSKYLLTHNLKHFKTDKINDELDLLILTPGWFLQFLRSR